MENIINFETFKQLNLEEIFNFFGKVYYRIIKLDSVLENVTVRRNSHEKKLNDIMQSRNKPSGNFRQCDRNQRQSNTTDKKSFVWFSLAKPRNGKLNIGLSIISRKSQNDLPRDAAIHAYPGSTTDENAGVVDSYKNKQLWTINLQDGTNSLLKQRSINVKNLSEKQKLLEENLYSKFRLHRSVICEIPPVKMSILSMIVFLISNENHYKPAIALSIL